jgi:hypothetical protein
MNILQVGARMNTPCHIVVEGNPAVIYASRGGHPDKILPVLERFLSKFWQERDISGETSDTPECLVAQIIVRFGFEICEDDFSNLRVGVNKFDSGAKYLYYISAQRELQVWEPTPQYIEHPEQGLAACRLRVGEPC